jgi:exonuclease III
MKILSWNLGLTNYYMRYYTMGITNCKPLSIYFITKFILGTNSNYDEENDYDILFFQEIYDSFDAIKQNLEHKYPHYIHINNIGISIFSKYKLENICYRKFNQDILNYITNINNGFMVCYLPEFKTYLCNVHFSCDINLFNSNNEFLKLNNYINSIKLKEDEKIVYGGDFNIKRIKFINYCKELNIIPKLTNKHKSYHYILPMNLDYLLCKTKNSNNELITNIIKTYESDHYPIITNI